jgi:hypothetical protein
LANQVNSMDSPASSLSAAVGRLGYWSAIMTALLATVNFIAGILAFARSGPFARLATTISYPYTDVASFIPADYIWLIPGILLAIAFVVLMACIHYHAPLNKKIFSHIGLSFALVYAAVIITDYFIQYTVVMPGLLSGETSGLSLLTQYNPHGLFVALEGLGFLMMSVAFLFAAFAFTGGKLEYTIRFLFSISTILAIAFFIVFSLLNYDIVVFEVAILTINLLVLIAAGGLLSILFKRAGRFGQPRPAESPAEAT